MNKQKYQLIRFENLIVYKNCCFFKKKYFIQGIEIKTDRKHKQKQRIMQSS